MTPFELTIAEFGIALGAGLLGSWLLGRLHSHVIRIVFVLVLFWVSLKMLLKGVR